ncbi:DegT/DnrJ/EryC1/StrS family aminotransferase [Candidatus Aerophobetes bacterium]|nr:DegT/DnrJ/EryC1/StrS family aminotransferase [Candidatus Aerophobetes bacterium]
MKIPYIGLREQHKNLRNEIMESISRVLDHSIFILGKEVEEFEKKFARYCGTKYAIGVNSGTDALFLALKCLGIGRGDEVITVPNSFIATASSIIATNAKPVFVDAREDMNINPDLIEAAITKNTRAIVPVHLTGRPAEMDKIMDIARKYGLYVVEDAAQAVGAEYKGKKVGSWGNVNCFSLHPLKNLNACGDGGIITTNDDRLYEKLLQMRNIGLITRDKANIWGYNSRLDTIQAAILNVKFKYLDRWIEKRRENAKFYNKELKGLVKVPEEKPTEKCVYHTYIIQTPERDKLKSFLEKNGIETKIHYPIPIHLQKCASNLGYAPGKFPFTEKQAKMILSLPIYPELTNHQISLICSTIKKFFDQLKR